MLLAVIVPVSTEKVMYLMIFAIYRRAGWRNDISIHDVLVFILLSVMLFKFYIMNN